MRPVERRRLSIAQTKFRVPVRQTASTSLSPTSQRLSVVLSICSSGVRLQPSQYCHAARDGVSTDARAKECGGTD